MQFVRLFFQSGSLAYLLFIGFFLSPFILAVLFMLWKAFIRLGLLATGLGLVTVIIGLFPLGRRLLLNALLFVVLLLVGTYVVGISFLNHSVTLR